VLRLLGRRCLPGDATDAEAAQTAYESFKAALAEIPLISTEAKSPVDLSNCVVAPLVRQESLGQVLSLTTQEYVVPSGNPVVAEREEQLSLDKQAQKASGFGVLICPVGRLFWATVSPLRVSAK
jgi:hypothetical protein